jgi:hypothetical protein
MEMLYDENMSDDLTSNPVIPLTKSKKGWVKKQKR